MAGNVQCPVCTLYLLPGMNLSDHLETHPKEQVIKALVQMSLKSETSEPAPSSDTPQKANKNSVPEDNDANQAEINERDSPTSEISGCMSNSAPVLEETNNTKIDDVGDSCSTANTPMPPNVMLNRQGGYVFENNSTSSSSSSSSNTFFGPPTPYYQQQQQQQQQQQHQPQQQQQQQQHNHHHHQNQQQQQQQLQHQQQQQQSSQSQQQQHLQSYQSYPNISRNRLPQGGNNTLMGSGIAQPPMRLFSYQPLPKPLQPPPAYGAAISQLRSQNSQNMMSHNVNRPLYSAANYTLPSTSSLSSSSTSTPSRLPPPLPPPPLNQRYQSSFDQIETNFNEATDTSMSPRRRSMTPPTRPPPQLYRSPQSSSNAQYSRQSSSPYSVMSGSPSVLRYAESPVTAHYLERENGDFIVQETPKHVVECVEKDDGEFSVIERVYHMPPSVVQINEDEEDEMSENGSNSEDVKLMEDERQTEAWSSENSSNLGQPIQLREQQHQKKSAITVLSDVQLDLSEYLDLVGNIIASGKAKNRTEIIKIEKFEPEEVKEEEMGQTICLDDDDDDMLDTNEQKVERIEDDKEQFGSEATFCPNSITTAFSKALITESSSSSTVAPVTTSVIRLAANVTSKTTINATTITTTATTSTFKEFVEGENFDKPTISKVEQSVDTVKSDESEEQVVNTVQENNKAPNSTPSHDDLELSGTSLLIKKTEEENKTTNLVNSNPQNQEQTPPTTPLKQIKNEVSSPILSFHQAVKRPIKKLPKKLIIKPKSKETATSRAIAQQPVPITDPAPLIPISTPLPSTSSESITIERQKEESKSEEEEQQQLAPQDEINIIKTESLSTTTSDSVLCQPLFADADEKLPPDDDLPQPSTSSSIMFPEVKKASEMLPSDEEKPTADLTAFYDECMKKEEEEDHPMHSIFGMDIGNTVETLNDALTPPPPTPEFPSPSLFAKPLTTNENLSSMSEAIVPDGSGNLQEPTDNNQLQHEQQQQQQQNNSNYVEYPFSFLYGGEANQQGEEDKHIIPAPIYCTEDFNKYSASTSGGNSASCTWYQSQSSENDFEIDGKGSYLDLDSCKRSNSFAAATEGSMPTSDALNIRTDEKMPAKGEISEQESNCGVENSWSQPLYNEFAVRFPNPYQNFMSNQESWSHDHYFRPQDLSSSVETKNFALRLTEESPPVVDSLPSTSKRRKVAITKVPRKKNFQCAHCNTHFPLLKEKNAHMIKQHGYKRVNRRLIRDPPTSTVTTATLNIAEAVGTASMLLGLEGALAPPALPNAEDEDSKVAIVKMEQEKQDECKQNLTDVALNSTKVSSSSSANTASNPSRTKYDSMRARDNRMLINFNLSALNVKNEGESAHNYYMESKSSFCCFVCKRDFLTVKLFDEHLVEHPAECFTCHKKFTRWKNFMVHLKRHLGWKDFGCTYCDKKFVIRSALVEHMRMHTGQTPLKCKICGKSFKRYSNLTQHRKRHGNKIHRTKEYVCYCGEVLPSKARFIWHKETHDVKPKCCPYCRDRFVHANSLRRHIRLAHSDKFDYTEPMECPMCKQIYAKSSIKAHMATHSMDTQHECLICNKSFSTKWNLKIHNWVHANRTTKPFKCEQCVKAFVREVDYNNHINSHKQIKPYTCEHCGCKFIRKYNYIRHRREHHGNKKFTCDLCGKLFHRHYYLIEHRRIHTGERPFQCTICGKSSTTKTNHNKHLKIHHSRDPFTSEA